MKCFHCINVVCHTEYPPNAIVSVCPRCLWRSKEQLLPSKIPPVQQVSLVNQPKSNIFDDIYINNEVRVDSMSQKVCRTCGNPMIPMSDEPFTQHMCVNLECIAIMKQMLKECGYYE